LALAGLAGLKVRQAQRVRNLLFRRLFLRVAGWGVTLTILRTRMVVLVVALQVLVVARPGQVRLGKATLVGQKMMVLRVSMPVVVVVVLVVRVLEEHRAQGFLPRLQILRSLVRRVAMVRAPTILLVPVLRAGQIRVTAETVPILALTSEGTAVQVWSYLLSPYKDWQHLARALRFRLERSA
jgi:hypothetical protein